VVQVLLQSCNCPYSLDYVTHSRLLCGSSTKEIIYQSNLLNADGVSATTLRDIVQQWIDTGPMIPVNGNYQSVDNYCQVSLSKMGDMLDCVAKNPTTPTAVESAEEATRPSYLVPAIAGSIGGIVGFAIILAVIVGVLCCCRRKAPDKRNILRMKSGPTQL